ncbi:MAG: hypothetical protein FWC91_05665 [Defluviitaleaceae bacterium]|nr:hypothetical protein [Defluviitaleaceae bacterium]
MKTCKKYIKSESASATYRTRSNDCSSCAYFSAKNCGAHLDPVASSLL